MSFLTANKFKKFVKFGVNTFKKFMNFCKKCETKLNVPLLILVYLAQVSGVKKSISVDFVSPIIIIKK